MIFLKLAWCGKGVRRIEKRFEVIHKQGAMEVFKIIRDNETGVLYMTNHSGYGGGITVMVDQDGKPLVDKAFKNSN